MHIPSQSYFRLIKKKGSIYGLYVNDTTHLGMQIHASSLTNLYAFANTDSVRYPLTKCSIIGFCIVLVVTIFHSVPSNNLP